MVLHVLARGKQDSVNFIVGVESKPKGGGLIAPVPKDNTFSKVA